MNFVYILSGWEGYASDSRILRDAITRHNSLKVPHGMYNTLAETGGDMNEQHDVEIDLDLNEDGLESPLGGVSSTVSGAVKIKGKKPKVNHDSLLLKKLTESFTKAIEQTCKSIDSLGNSLAGPKESVGEVLSSLGYNDDKIVQAAMKLIENPLMEKTFWSLTSTQKNFVS